jgi:hypothetical protein
MREVRRTRSTGMCTGPSKGHWASYGHTRWGEGGPRNAERRASPIVPQLEGHDECLTDYDRIAGVCKMVCKIDRSGVQRPPEGNIIVIVGC